MLANREFELKLALSQEDFDHLSANPTLSEHRDDRSEKTLKSVYYDTPDFRLRDLGVSLRVREDGDGFVQTVKAEAGIENGISNPIQMEAPVTGPEPDLERISDKGMRRQLADAVSDSTLTGRSRPS
jgi:inorganic triphosphatase YgiF